MLECFNPLNNYGGTLGLPNLLCLLPFLVLNLSGELTKTGDKLHQALPLYSFQVFLYRFGWVS